MATASLGATWSSCSPDFGLNGVLDRSGQIGPKVLIACDGYRYGGKALGERIARAIRCGLTPRHVPARIVPCPEVPRTISGKITEIAVRELIHGRPARNAGALANPQSLDYFKNLSPEAFR